MPIVTADPRSNPHATDALTGPHGSTDDHGETHGHDDHAHAGGAKLGPLDARAWGAGIVGLLLGVAVAVALAMSSGYRPF
jgi:hypothetical protein